MRKQILVGLAVTLFVSATEPPLRAQSPAVTEEKLSFEVASVKANKSDARQYSNVPLSRGRLYAPTGGLLSTTNIPLSEYIKFAYPWQFEVDPKLPPWVFTERFDITARVAGNPTKDQMRAMMRALLMERFKLSLHKETQQLSAFSLTLLKPGTTGPGLRQHPPADSPCSSLRYPTDRGTEMVPGLRLPVPCGDFFVVRPCPSGRLCTGVRDVSMAMIATFFGSKFQRPVIDRTGLTGTYDMTLERAPAFDIAGGSNDTLPPGVEPDPSAPTIQEAIKVQLGLKLESTKAPIEKLVVDHIERPSEN